VAANVLGTLSPGIGEVNASPNSVVGNILGHVALGCATSSMQGTGCAGGAAGGLAGSVVAPLVGMGLYAGTSGTNSAIDAATVAIGAMAGGAIAHAIGGDTTAGASTAQNAAMNNWLEHRRPNPVVYSEQERRDNAAAACKQHPEQCDVANGWDAVSKQRDANLQAACANLSSDTCRSAMAAAQAAGNYIVFAGGKVYAYGKEDPVARSLDPSPAAKTLDTMVGSPLAGVFGGLPYFKSNADPAAGYYFAQYGMALEGIGAGVLGLPTGPLAGPGWRAALESPNTLYVGSGAGSALPTWTNVAGPYSAVGQGGGAATTVQAGPGYTAGDVLPTTAPAPRVSNGVALDPRLPDPVAGLGYQPKVLSSSSPNIAYSQVNGYVGELNLANTVAQLPDQTVVRYGDAVGTHGADIVSVNSKSGEVTLWDNKYRSGATKIDSSPTFTPNSQALNNAITEATKAIESSNLPDSVKRIALSNIERGNVTTNTVGEGGAKNSTTVKLCGGKPC
ncbi:DUF6862 domain-containing protein, partial [Ralstonia pseudosolanacearum]